LFFHETTVYSASAAAAAAACAHFNFAAGVAVGVAVDCAVGAVRLQIDANRFATVCRNRRQTLTDGARERL